MRFDDNITHSMYSNHHLLLIGIQNLEDYKDKQYSPRGPRKGIDSINPKKEL